MGHVDSPGIGQGLIGGALGSQQGLGGLGKSNLSDYANQLFNKGMWETATTSSSNQLTATYVNQAIDNLWNQQQHNWQHQSMGGSVTLNPEDFMGGHSTDYSKWWYDPATRQWDDGTGNKFQSLPYGVSPIQTSMAKDVTKEKRTVAEEDVCAIFTGEFTPKVYGDWFRSRLQRLYAA